MLIGGVIALCVVLFLLALIAPRLSRHPQRGVDRAWGLGARGGSKAPGKLGRWLAKPFTTGRKASDRSAAAGRKSRDKLPL
jgi:Family of unknown function (DUF6411)